MANTRADAVGFDRSRVKETHQLGSESSKAQAATWRTFAIARIDKDGSGEVEVVRDGRRIHFFEFGPEGVEE